MKKKKKEIKSCINCIHKRTVPGMNMYYTSQSQKPPCLKKRKQKFGTIKCNGFARKKGTHHYKPLKGVTK